MDTRSAKAARAAPSGRSQIAETVNAGLRRRYRAERRFRAYGIIAILVALGMLATLFVTIIGKGYTAFWQHSLELNVAVPADAVNPQDLGSANYLGLLRDALQAQFPEVDTRQERRALFAMLSDGAPYALQDAVAEDPSVIGRSVTVQVALDDDFDMLAKGHIDANLPEAQRRLSDAQVAWYQALAERGMIEGHFNTTLFTSGDSRQAEMSGIWGAVVGSFFTLAVTLALSFPIGVATAVYLEEFAPKNRFTDLIEVNINNLAAVPSIVFGLLGLAVFLQFFGLPRSAPLVGGLVLTLMTLPTIIIASRAALKSVPPSIREAALGLGASKLQMILHHVLPLAMPGMLTGTIIGMAQALGESAPLLMIGMVAFVVDIPNGPLDPSTVLPVQIFLWADSPERAFVERTSAAIMVLLAFLVFMNAAAVWLRKKFERRW
ncbi:MAG: phosphate ABC transporter permease PstA [Rhodospirillaceae bacterium]